jgi:hypothetical protein
MPFMDRDSFIGLLERLGSPDDAEALAAAREIDGRMKEAGLSWEDLLVPPPPPPGVNTYDAPDDEDLVEAVRRAAADGDDDDGPLLGPDDEDEAPRRASADPERWKEERALIETLLAEHQLSASTRAELKDYRTDIDEGDFSEMDARYLRALAARLGAGGKRKG